MMVVTGLIKDIKITAVASDFDFLGPQWLQLKVKLFFTVLNMQYRIRPPFICISAGGGMRMMESLISLSQMTRTTLAINELKKTIYPTWYV